MAELSEALARFVEAPNVAILGTLMKDGSPHLTAVWYLYEDGVVKLSITTGRMKYRHVMRDPRVSLLIADNTPPYMEVVFRGAARIEHEGGAAFLRRIAIHYHGAEAGNRYADYDERETEDPRVVLHFTPQHITAHDFGAEEGYYRPRGSG